MDICILGERSIVPAPLFIVMYGEDGKMIACHPLHNILTVINLSVNIGAVKTVAALGTELRRVFGVLRLPAALIAFV